ncbi:hypothetical protein LXA43DRAFT_902571 [Ganoderma leucocontextum]|nr:hypothetical protein LXA43DRAFT_902571 [Ganoderma leucocontextum]
MSEVDVIDCTVSQPPPQPEEWIGHGLKWPTSTRDIPDELNRLYQQHFAVPIAYTTDSLYNPTETVSAFLGRQLQTQSKALTYHLATSHFSHLFPNATLNTDNTTPIPPVPLLYDMKKASGQSLLDGAKSIEYPLASGKRYDLWMLQYWFNIRDVLELQSTWQLCREWLNGSCTRDPVAASVFTAALEELDQLECNAFVTALNAKSVRTSALARLVSDAWISDDVIDMMVAHEMARVQLEPKLAGHVIAHLAIVNTILKAQGPASWDKPSQRHVANLERKIASKSVHELYLPVFWAECNHWIAMRISFTRKEVMYGDSLGRKLPKPQKLLDKILWWLSKRFSDKFRIVGQELESGEQIDTYSCGICAMNAISRSIFGDTLWTDSRKALLRARWFRDICKEHRKTKVSHAILNLGGTFTDLPYQTLGDLHLTVPDQGRPADAEDRMRVSYLLNAAGESANQHLDAFSRSQASHDIGTLVMNAQPILEDSPSSRPPPMDPFTPSSASRAHSSMSTTTSFPPSHSCPPLPPSSSPGPIHRSQSPPPPTRVESAAADRLRPDAEDKAARKRDTPGVIGVSRSNRHSTAANKAAKEGTFRPKPSRLAIWKMKVRDLHDELAFDRGIRVLQEDEPVEFPDPQQGKVVRHVRCGQTVSMKTPCNTAHWQTHINRCLVEKGATRTKAAGMHTLLQLASNGLFSVPPAVNPTPRRVPTQKSSVRAPSLPNPPCLSRPCPGLDVEQFPQIASYLSRPGALGGGARSVSVISHEQFGQRFRDLSKRAKREVNTIQRHEWVWRNEHDVGKIFADACEKFVSVPPEVELAPPCERCHGLLSSKAFQHLLRIPIPRDDNMKFVNKGYQHKELVKLYGKVKGLREILEHPDPKRSPFIQFTLSALDGSFQDHIFTGLVEAVMVKKDKLERGVGMQNFKFAPAYDEFLHIINAHSPKAYRFFRQHLPGRTQRSIQYNEALQPRFPIGVCDETFSIVAGHLDALEYNGPVGLGCDDTKLLAGFDPVYDKGKGAFLVLGGIGEPMPVANPEEVTRAIQDGKIKKAEKIRIWIIQIPLPGVLPIILAAVGIGNKTTASFLWDYHERILTGLCEHNINVVTSAHDGATTERNVQRKLYDTATASLQYSIKHPARDTSIRLDIPCFGPSKQPIIPLQDANHGQKTYRNNLFSGCTLLTLGNEVAMYKHIRDMAFSDDGPLYRRDVEKVDRQDDNAATRLFSADALQWLSTHDEARHRATSVYLFVYGELGSVYSSRKDDISERTKMALRAEFFTDLWELWLGRNGYSKARHFLSHQAAAITRTLTRGFLQLHLFGMCRTIVKDFKMLDFYYMIPKLLTQLRASIFTQYHGNEKARASGYNHTYFDNHSVDLALLRRFPSDSAITSIAQVAFDEALGLFALLGVSPDDLLGSSPSLDLALTSGDLDPGLEDENDDCDGDDWDDDDSSVVEDLLDDALAIVEDLSMDTHTEDEVMKITYAAISLSVDTHIRMYDFLNQLPEHDDEAADELMFEAANMIAKLLEKSRAAKTQDSASDPTGTSTVDALSIDLSELVRLRRAHQTRQAARGVRTRGQPEECDAPEGSEADATRTRQKLLAKLREILKSKLGDDVAVGTGLERAARWIRGSTVEDDSGGNVANAAQAAKTRASKCIVRRRKIYKEKVGGIDVLQEGRVSPMSPLKSDESSFGYVLVGDQICLGHGKFSRLSRLTHASDYLVLVLSVYSKGGGKNGKHAWVPSVDTIGATSYIPTQVYNHTFARTFTAAKRDAISRGRRKTYALVDSNTFLCLTHNPPKAVNGNLELSAQDIQLYRNLVEALPSIREAVKKLRARKRGQGGAGAEDEVSDDE